MAWGARFLKLTPWHYIPQKKLQSVFRPNAICKRKLCAMNVCGLSAIVDFIKLILLLCSGVGIVWIQAKTFTSSPLDFVCVATRQQQSSHVEP
jgi:hypothetical protein